MKRGLFQRLPLIEIAALAVLGSVMYRLLCCEPIVGLADQGDYFRVMEKAGLRFLSDSPEERYFWYVNRYFGRCERLPGSYFSSEIPIARCAVFFDDLLTRDDRFALPAIGAIHAALFLAGIGWILFAASGARTALRLLLAALIVLVYGDVGYAAWFNSLYSEPASIAFLAFTIGASLSLAKCDLTRRRRWGAGAAFYVAAFLFLTAKPQNGPCGAVLVALGYYLTTRGLEPQPDRLRRWARRAMAATPGMVLLILAAALSLTGQPSYMREANLYNVVFGDLLANSPTPEDDMKALGIDDASFVRLIGRDMFTRPDPIVHSARFRERFYGSIGYGKILRFYASRPSRVWSLIDRSAAQASSVRPPAMGNFEHGAAIVMAGSEEAYVRPDRPLKSDAFSLWSRFKAAAIPKSGLFLVVFLGASVAAAGVKFILFDDGPRARGVSAIHLSIVAMTAIQFLTAIVGEGTVAIVKHLFLFNVLFDALAIFGALYALYILLSPSDAKRRVFSHLTRPARKHS